MKKSSIFGQCIYFYKMSMLVIISVIITSFSFVAVKAIDNIECTIEYVSGNWAYETGSESELFYLVYIPDKVSDNTQIVLFLHGNGEVNGDWNRVFERYEFVKNINTNRFIFIFPLETKKCNWQNDIKKLNIIIDEVCMYTGAKRDGNLYISGVSAGADAVSDVASKIDFQGAIYMAGSLKGSKNKMTARQVADLWQGKTIYYFRDNLHGEGGYNYDEKFIAKLLNYSQDGSFHFVVENLNWDHSHCLVDAVFDSDYRRDGRNQNCHGMLDKLFVGHLEYEVGKLKYKVFRLIGHADILNVIKVGY